MIVLGVLVVLLGILLYASKVKAEPKALDEPELKIPDAVERAKEILEGAGIPDAVERAKEVLEEARIPETLDIEPPQPVAPLKVPMETKVIKQINVEVKVPTIAYVKEQIAKAALTGDISGGMSEKVFEEYFQKPAAEAIGLTMPEVPSYSAVCDKVNLELGGKYVSGILTAPSGWTGSITEWSRYVQKVGLEKYNELK